MTRSRLAALGALLGLFLLVGCSKQPNVAPTLVVPKPSASSAYLAEPVRDGWLRTVGRTGDLVLVFECQPKATRKRDLPYQFVLFNDGSVAQRWDDALFVVRFEDSGFPGVGFIGDYPISYPGHFDPPALELDSGESTTHTGAVSGRAGDGSQPYDSRLTPSFRVKGRTAGQGPYLITCPPVTVRLE